MPGGLGHVHQPGAQVPIKRALATVGEYFFPARACVCVRKRHASSFGGCPRRKDAHDFWQSFAIGAKCPLRDSKISGSIATVISAIFPGSAGQPARPNQAGFVVFRGFRSADGLGKLGCNARIN
jgi:hypothetical protein